MVIHNFSAQFMFSFGYFITAFVCLHYYAVSVTLYNHCYLYVFM